MQEKANVTTTLIIQFLIAKSLQIEVHKYFYIHNTNMLLKPKINTKTPYLPEKKCNPPKVTQLQGSKLYLNSIFCWTVCTSVAKPVRPSHKCGAISKHLLKSVVTVCNSLPNRRSDAMATQSLPFIATQAPPLYEKML